MSKLLIVRANEYHDSVQLMQVSRQLRGEPGVRQAMVAMGTDSNKQILRDIGLWDTAGESATVNDMMIALEAATEAGLEAAVQRMDALFRERAARRPGGRTHFTLSSALRATAGANLCVISVPGAYAAAEARKALEAGLHVFIYSDNVPMNEERELKALAARKGLLCMGPDCGVANINGIALGTASIAKRGSIGLVGASGSGTQQIAVLADRLGPGVSQAIGTGGKDLKDEVGGVAMLMGIDALEEDGATRVIVLVSRTPGAKTLPKILDRIRNCSKPVVVYFIGGDPKRIEAAGATAALDLEDAAVRAVALAEGRPAVRRSFSISDAEVEAIVGRETARLKREQRYLRGLFVGGTFAEEAMALLRETIGDVYSNAPLRPDRKLADSLVSREHSIIDLGDEEFTVGRPHPGIDPEPIRHAIAREGRDSGMAVLLMDFILGPALNPDPVGSVIDLIRQIKNERERAGGYLSFVASVCGTEGDPQNAETQERMLREAGAVVMPSNAQAARMAGLIARRAQQLRNDAK